MEFEIDELSCDCWDELQALMAPANHPPEWSRDCTRSQTGVLIPEESVPVELTLVTAE